MPETDHAHGVRPDEAAGRHEGGDDACWLDRVCDECGAIVDAGVAHVCRRPTESREEPR